MSEDIIETISQEIADHDMVYMATGEKAIAEIKALREALNKYGKHEDTCTRYVAMYTGAGCTCGLDKALKKDEAENDKSELLPCPFCGDEASVNKDPNIFCHQTYEGYPENHTEGFRIECEGQCHAMTCWWHTKDEAVKTWNNRTKERRGRE